MDFPKRHALVRARFFLERAEECTFERRDHHEAFLETAIIFARTALHRLKTRHERQPGWKEWWSGLLSNPSVEFIRRERDFILKDAPPKVGQILYGGGSGPSSAKYYYYYEDPQTPASETVRRHVAEIERIVIDGESRFGTGQPLP